jgi:hypothetical protein
MLKSSHVHDTSYMQQEGILFLDPADEKAQKIGKAIASPLAGDMLQHFSQGPMTLSRVSEALQVPMNTAKYHIENLLQADLLEVVDTRYSVKGREVKVYGLKNQVLIVAPKKMDLRSLLKQYASAFVVAIAATFTLFLLQPLLTAPAPLSPPLLQSVPEAGPPLVRGISVTPLYTMEMVGAFFAGALLMIALAAGFEYYRRRKARSLVQDR